MEEVTDGSSYKRPAGWRERLRAEGGQLHERCGKLKNFLGSEDFGKLDEAEQKLLAEQLTVMSRYLEILSERMARATGQVYPPEEGGAPGSTLRAHHSLVEHVRLWSGSGW